MYQHSMAFAAATSPGVAGPIRCNSETSQSNRKEIKSFLIQCSISQIQVRGLRHSPILHSLFLVVSLVGLAFEDSAVSSILIAT